ncbi:hypothetical protein E0F26_03150 [Candidatus Paraluminiphilus aquimaris]|uniref:Uncharacterized protein n=1 Tax=Candidatus Paraluminiphilus aquimaris TaxID=2518994 RepID=A0ABY6Q5A9_9GAMM|nr:hypothetical protein [Candidatus Paraluminiphilus aquimaris]UZP73799.1 hypothetical protein E0F26_03150 [Candidatus Paraluminiphilus aquimaris]
MKTVSSQVLVAALFALSASLVVSPFALATEMLINQKTGAVRVLGHAPSNQVALHSSPSEKRESTREARAQTAKQLAARKGLDRLPVGGLLAITKSHKDSVRQVVLLVGERARVMDRPLQKNGLQVTVSDVLYTLPDFLTNANSAGKVEVEVWQKVGDRQFAWLIAL